MDQRVLVTAGASGIGREIARAFAAQGARVFVCDLDATGLGKLAHEIPGLATTVCDMSKRGDIERMVPFGIDALGGLDVLVNNAGIAGPTARSKRWILTSGRRSSRSTSMAPSTSHVSLSRTSRSHSMV
jgi:NAD(P)-dependent dehydrogenase (short-subunit alcohol dehydrogenase family)